MRPNTWRNPANIVKTFEYFPQSSWGVFSQILSITPTHLGDCSRGEIPFDKTKQWSSDICLNEYREVKPGQTLLSGFWSISKRNSFKLFNQCTKIQRGPGFLREIWESQHPELYSKTKLVPDCCWVRATRGLCILAQVSSAGNEKLGVQICTTQRPCSLTRDLILLVSNQKRVLRSLDCGNSGCYFPDDSRIKENSHVLVFQLDERMKVQTWMRDLVNFKNN